MPEELTFQIATSAEIPTLRMLAPKIWRASYAELLSPEQIDYMLQWMYAPEQIERELTAGIQWRIARVAAEPVGYLSVTLPPNQSAVPSCAEPRAELHKLYLLPGLHGRGLGRAMLEHACSMAAEAGCKAIFLRVNRRNNRALHVYARNGFRAVGQVVSEIGGGFVMDDEIMERSLDPRAGGLQNSR